MRNLLWNQWVVAASSLENCSKSRVHSGHIESYGCQSDCHASIAKKKHIEQYQTPAICKSIPSLSRACLHILHVLDFSGQGCANHPLWHRGPDQGPADLKSLGKSCDSCAFTNNAQESIVTTTCADCRKTTPMVSCLFFFSTALRNQTQSLDFLP